jgi:hypothetical protein
MVVGTTDVKRLGELGGHHIKATDHARRLAPILPVHDPAAQDDFVADDRRRRTRIIIAQIGVTHPGQQIDLTVNAKVAAWLTRPSIQREQARIDCIRDNPVGAGAISARHL